MVITVTTHLWVSPAAEAQALLWFPDQNHIAASGLDLLARESDHILGLRVNNALLLLNMVINHAAVGKHAWS